MRHTAKYIALISTHTYRWARSARGLYLEVITAVLEKNVGAIPISEMLVTLQDLWSGATVDEARYHELSDGDDLESALVTLLHFAVLDSPSRAVEVLLDRLGQDPQFYELMHSAIEIAFASNAACDESESRFMKSAVVDTLVKNELVWQVDLHLPGLLAAYDLPDSLSKMRYWSPT